CRPNRRASTRLFCLPRVHPSRAMPAQPFPERLSTHRPTGRERVMVKNAEKASYRHRARMTPRRAASALAERWTMIDGVDVFYRESANPPDARVMTHLHGFGLSGRYLLPTAELLADEFHTYVPDLPGFGRSGKK